MSDFCPEHGANLCMCYDCVSEPFQEEIEALEKQIEALKWISVKDRLPENYETVLFFNSNKFYAIGHIDKFLWIDNTTHAEILGVTHWVPLPEPPEVGN